MNERSTRQPDVTPDASRRFLRHESDRELLGAASAVLDRVIVADSLAHRLAAWVDLIDYVRHVTLSTGTLALTCAGLGKGWFHGGWFLWAMAGIGVMFVLNLGVSFLLSLYTASRAYDLPRSFMFDFARAVGRRFLARPGAFVLPPRADAPAREH